jgi:hypothetical protein
MLHDVTYIEQKETAWASKTLQGLGILVKALKWEASVHERFWQPGSLGNAYQVQAWEATVQWFGLLATVNPVVG